MNWLINGDSDEERGQWVSRRQPHVLPSSELPILIQHTINYLPFAKLNDKRYRKTEKYFNCIIRLAQVQVFFKILYSFQSLGLISITRYLLIRKNEVESKY